MPHGNIMEHAIPTTPAEICMFLVIFFGAVNYLTNLAHLQTAQYHYDLNSFTNCPHLPQKTQSELRISRDILIISFMVLLTLPGWKFFLVVNLIALIQSALVGQYSSLAKKHGYELCKTIVDGVLKTQIWVSRIVFMSIIATYVWFYMYT